MEPHDYVGKNFFFRICSYTLGSYTGHMDTYASTVWEIWTILRIFREKIGIASGHYIAYRIILSLERGQNWQKITPHMLLDMHKSYYNTSLAHSETKYKVLCLVSHPNPMRTVLRPIETTLGCIIGSEVTLMTSISPNRR